MSETDTQNWREGFYTSQDGLRLYARHYPAGGAAGRPLLCLAGLTRNARDFHALATALSRHANAPRDVYCLDYRGRGRSDHDGNWKNYTPYIELLDVLDFMTVAGLHGAAVLGTSRGGIITMMMAVLRPTALAVAILNDVGPVLEPRGIERIMGYVGRGRVPASWPEAAAAIRRVNEAYFPDLTDEAWTRLAHQWFDEEDGKPAQAYDDALANSFGQLELSKLPRMWPQFNALANLPALLIRGENSDLLSEETAEKMAARHAMLHRLTIPGQGHAPLLDDGFAIERIGHFLAETDAGGAGPQASAVC